MKQIDEMGKKLAISMFTYGLVIGGVLGAILYYLLPQYYPNWYLPMLGFFLILEPLLVYYIDKSSQTATQQQLVNSYMITKVLKIVGILSFITIYYLVVKENIKVFVVVFIGLYLLFLIAETRMFTQIEQKLKEKEQEKNKIE